MKENILGSQEYVKLDKFYSNAEIVRICRQRDSITTVNISCLEQNTNSSENLKSQQSVDMPTHSSFS